MTIDLNFYFVIVTWAFAISIIIIGIIFNWHGKHWWSEPFVIGSTISFLAILLYGIFFKQVLLPYDIFTIIVDKMSILILILSFAYIAISIDKSGFFDYCAKIIVQWSNGNGNKLFIFLFILVSLLTFVTSNDVVILTMTPIVIYICRSIGIKNMIPYLISQFFAANILSMGLYIGSPTNIVIADAVGITFIQYSMYMIVPAIISGLFALLLLFWVFKKSKSNSFVEKFNPLVYPDLKFTSQMKIRVLILFGLLLTAALTSLPNFNFEIWEVSLLFALFIALIDIYYLNKSKKSIPNNYKKIAERLPWGIVPFALSFFVIIEALNKIGISDFIAHQLKEIVFLVEGENIMLLWSSIIFGEVSAFMVNIMNDIPATVFLADILVTLQNDPDISNNLFTTILTSTLVGVNPGCNMTLIGALAGLMWFNILKKEKEDYEIMPSITKLTLLGVPLMILIIAIGSFTAWLQVLIIL